MNATSVIIVFVLIIAIVILIFVPGTGIQLVNLFVGAGQSRNIFIGGVEPVKYTVVHVNDVKTQSEIPYHDQSTNINKVHYTRNNNYLSHSSNNQIRQIIKTGKINDKARLMMLLCRNGNIYDFYKYMKMNDNEVYTAIKNQSRKYVSNPDERGLVHAHEFKKILSRNVDTDNIKTYLDYGCGDGSFSGSLAGLLGLPNADCIEVETPQNASKVQVVNDNLISAETPPSDTKTAVSFKIIKPGENVLPYPDNHFDLITALMSLHHVTNLEQICNEIMRVLKPGGILMYKEHDCWDAYDAMLVDIEHAIYLKEKDDYGHAVQFKNYYGWGAMFKDLKWVDWDYYSTTLHNDVTPTRAFWTIMKKNKTESTD
jgi:SAM-dependent methyltransferase